MKNFLAINLLTWSFVTGNAQQKTGLLVADVNDKTGYILFAPLQSKTTFLIDKDGGVVHSWKSNWLPAQSAYLLTDGSLLRTGVDTSNTYFPRSGGWLEKFDWNNRLVWSYLISDKNQRRHHDIYPMANGNILVLIWEKKTPEQAIAAGRDPKLLGNDLWSEKIIEIRPLGDDSAEIVWEWHLWDHLVQDHDKSKGNFGNVSNSPGLVNINFKASKDNDWLHFNSISYNSRSDQILISNRNFSEIFILDHSTTTQEAATHKGGKSGKGGDLLYRWGNPKAYNRGEDADQKLFSQHSAQWVDDTTTDKVIVFNNGVGRPAGNYSSVDVLDIPYGKNGSYKFSGTYGPGAPLRSYVNETPASFYSPNISSAQQMSNGHIMVCEGVKAKFFEVDEQNKIVWSYVSPFSDNSESGNEQIGRSKVFKCIYYDPSYPGLKNLSDRHIIK